MDCRIHGSYESLMGGSSCEAMEDFTGGITEVFDLMQELPANLFDIVTKSVERESMMGCAIDVDDVSQYYSIFRVDLISWGV